MINLLTVQICYSSLIEFVTTERNNFDYYETLVLKISTTESYEKGYKRALSRNKKYDGGADSEEVELDGRESIRINTFFS